MNYRFLILIWLGATFPSHSQSILKETDESVFVASTKQVNQFLRRFNGEEDANGEKYLPTDKHYRDTKIRQRYISSLFDQSNTGIPIELKRDFIAMATDKKNPVFLDFHGPNWTAEVATQFDFYGKSNTVILFLKLEQEGQGYEWVIEKVSIQALDYYFDKKEGDEKAFIHPMSHELDFMNLRKAFESGTPEAFTPDGFAPDMLTLFLYEVKKGNLRFRSVERTTFHFFQLDGWYFELSNFNRAGDNSGWLISNLVKLESGQKEALQKFIFHEK